MLSLASTACGGLVPLQEWCSEAHRKVLNSGDLQEKLAYNRIMAMVRNMKWKIE